MSWIFAGKKLDVWEFYEFVPIFFYVIPLLFIVHLLKHPGRNEKIQYFRGLNSLVVSHCTVFSFIGISDYLLSGGLDFPHQAFKEIWQFQTTTDLERDPP